MQVAVWIMALAIVSLAALLAWVWLDSRRARRDFDRALSEALERFREDEMERLRLEERELARREAQTTLVRWKLDEEEAIRSDAIRRSQATMIGKVTEHLAPFLSEFPYDPTEVRFLGSPVDLVVFSGMDYGEVEVVFIEVKALGSTLTTRQRRCRDAVRAGRVRWEEFRV